MISNIGKQMNLLYTEEALEFIVDASGGHPFIARQLCSLVYKTRDENKTGKVALKELQDAAALLHKWKVAGAEIGYS